MAQRPSPSPSAVEERVAQIKAAYPHLPDHLTPELEAAHLETLGPWLDRVRRHWNERANEEDPVLASANPHRTLDMGQMGAVLCAVDEAPLTGPEQRAWNELFVTLSAHLLKMARQYHDRYCQDSLFEVDDLFGAAVFAFFYSLSSYDPSRGARLFTHVYLDAPRHVRRYVEFYARPIRPGSGRTQRLRARAYRAGQRFEAARGRAPRPDELADELARGGTKTDRDAAALVLKEGDEFLHPPIQLSLDGPVGPASAGGLETRADFVHARPSDTEALFDPLGYLERRSAGDADLVRTLRKLVLTPLRLTPPERFALSL